MRDVYNLLCLQSAELSKAFGLKNLCYSKISVVMLLGYRIAVISQKLGSERNKMPCAKMWHKQYEPWHGISNNVACAIHAWCKKI